MGIYQEQQATKPIERTRDLVRRRHESDLQHRKNRHVQDEQGAWQVSTDLSVFDPMNHANARAKALV